jgi:hypothetical protein
VPLIAVRLGLDPYGFMGKSQALLGCTFNDTDTMSAKVFALVHKRLPDKGRLFEAALSGYAESESFADSAWRVKNLLHVFESATPAQVERVLEAFRGNPQNRESFAGRSVLASLLSRWTDEEWIVAKDGDVVRAAGNPEDDIPF